MYVHNFTFIATILYSIDSKCYNYCLRRHHSLFAFIWCCYGGLAKLPTANWLSHRRHWISRKQWGPKIHLQLLHPEIFEIFALLSTVYKLYPSFQPHHMVLIRGWRSSVAMEMTLMKQGSEGVISSILSLLWDFSLPQSHIATTGAASLSFIMWSTYKLSAVCKQHVKGN